MDSSSQSPPVPPVPFQQFEYSFPSLPFPLDAPLDAPPDVPPFPLSPPSASLFSTSEHTNLLGFLDSFDWDFDPSIPLNIPSFNGDHDHGFNTPPVLSPGGVQLPPLPPLPLSPSSLSIPTPPNQPSMPPTPTLSEMPTNAQPPMNALALSNTTTTGSASPPFPTTSTQSHVQNHSRNIKPLLSTPQKRLNHIMSEQKRRNTIRDGYATLEILLAPDGQPITQSTLTRGRPRAGRGRGRGKGKSGVLFRAVEYCKWLEESMDDLSEEVERLEAAAAANTRGAPLYSYP